MSSVKPEFRTITAALADEIRHYSHVSGVSVPEPERASGLLQENGVFGPIETVTATGRCHCRLCGALIEKGSDCLKFVIDFYLREFGRWGHKTNAYLHTECPPIGRENQ